MTERLTQEQLGQIVAEVEQLSQRREAEFDQEQVQQILQELNLPPELLDEALIQLRRRQALQEQQRRQKWIFGGIACLVIIAVLGAIFFTQQHNSEIARVSAQQNRIALGQNDNSDLKVIPHQISSELYYLVTLKDAPVGKRLNLSCNWSDSNGQIVKENRYQTSEVTTPVWNTFCRYKINSTAPTGTWKVQMFLEGRLLSTEKFEVK